MGNSPTEDYGPSSTPSFSLSFACRLFLLSQANERNHKSSMMVISLLDPKNAKIVHAKPLKKF